MKIFKDIIFYLWKWKGEAEWVAVLQYLLPCQLCPAEVAEAAWAQHLSLVPKGHPRGASAPFEAEIYCWKGGLWSRDSAWRVTYPEILFSAWGVVEENGVVFPSLPLLTTKPGPRGFVALIFCSKTLESLPEKRGNNFFSVRAAWKHYFCSAPL